ncbi:MAG: hypothetical protein COT84_03190 [Chlamydiae bacterium CG10_big_fil_rev_8_21_14_0_10_35_9]|nr:MAG: hypothetical protein COT84_03190 [Chlamydiae bacterium CG10_big_fil_rev_8_21_14_0_10_35_9]
MTPLYTSSFLPSKSTDLFIQLTEVTVQKELHEEVALLFSNIVAHSEVSNPMQALYSDLFEDIKNLTCDNSYQILDKINKVFLQIFSNATDLPSLETIFSNHDFPNIKEGVIHTLKTSEKTIDLVAKCDDRLDEIEKCIDLLETAQNHFEDKDINKGVQALKEFEDANATVSDPIIRCNTLKDAAEMLIQVEKFSLALEILNIAQDTFVVVSRFLNTVNLKANGCSIEVLEMAQAQKSDAIAMMERIDQLTKEVTDHLN